MNVWKLTASSNLVRFEEDAHPIAGKRRVRITKVYVNSEDALIFMGKRRVKYPLIPGRFAVGLVADEGGSHAFPKGARVLLHHYLPADDSGTEKKTFTEDEFRICGQTDDGFLRDFVYVREDEMTLLPEQVSDEKALLLPVVALARATIEPLEIQRGQHIAVIGANILGLMISRLLIYYQTAPLLIDYRRDRLDFARSRGVYYNSLNDEHLMNMVGTITGGRLADGVVFVPSAGDNDKELSVKVCAAGRSIVFSGHTNVPVPLDLSDVIKKCLAVYGVPDGTDYIETAINLMANKVVDPSVLRFVTTPVERVGNLFADLAANPERPLDEINVISLV